MDTRSVMKGDPLLVDLKEDGILWLINKACFHPRGFALASNGIPGEFILLGDGNEPWAFDQKVDDEKFAAVEAVLARAAIENQTG